MSLNYMNEIVVRSSFGTKSKYETMYSMRGEVSNPKFWFLNTVKLPNLEHGT